MFEMGVKVQVLKRGTMFAMRAAKLYELYRNYPSLEALPDAERAFIEKNLFRASLEDIWAQTRAFFLQRDPAQVPRAEGDPSAELGRRLGQNGADCRDRAHQRPDAVR